MKKIVYITMLSCIIPVFYADAYTFTRNLSVGSTGVDVFELQKFLNSNSETVISSQGVGSQGNETTYFGEKTKQAVIKLQNLNATEILYPNGLLQGTGFVGKSTIAFLNSTQTKETGASTPESPQTSNTQENQGSNTSSLPTVPEFLISTHVIKPDHNFYVGSQHELTDVSFFLNDNELRKDCKTKYTCVLHVPEKTNPDTYTVRTENSSWGEYSMTVLSSSTPKPKINLSPKSLNLTGENLIHGDNLSKKITIFTMFGIFESETENNSFILEFPSEYTKSASSTKGLFYVENDNGMRSDILNIQYEK